MKGGMLGATVGAALMWALIAFVNRPVVELVEVLLVRTDHEFAFAAQPDNLGQEGTK